MTADFALAVDDFFVRQHRAERRAPIDGRKGLIGKPVFVLPMAGRSAKLQRFHAELERRGLARPFVGNLTAAQQPPLAETDRAAEELLRRYDGWG